MSVWQPNTPLPTPRGSAVPEVPTTTRLTGDDLTQRLREIADEYALDWRDGDLHHDAHAMREAADEIDVLRSLVADMTPYVAAAQSSDGEAMSARHDLDVTDCPDTTLHSLVARCTCGWQQTCSRISDCRARHSAHVQAEADWDLITATLTLVTNEGVVLAALARRRGSR